MKSVVERNRPIELTPNRRMAGSTQPGERDVRRVAYRLNLPLRELEAVLLPLRYMVNTSWLHQTRRNPEPVTPFFPDEEPVEDPCEENEP